MLCKSSDDHRKEDASPKFVERVSESFDAAMISPQKKISTRRLETTALLLLTCLYSKGKKKHFSVVLQKSNSIMSDDVCCIIT